MSEMIKMTKKRLRGPWTTVYHWHPMLREDGTVVTYEDGKPIMRCGIDEEATRLNEEREWTALERQAEFWTQMKSESSIKDCNSTYNDYTLPLVISLLGFFIFYSAINYWG